MDELERLVNVYEARESSSVRSRLDVLMDLERIRDPRVVPFLLRVLSNQDESDEVRVHVIRQLRTDTGLLVPSDHTPVAKALADVLTDASADSLRLQAALALGDFTQIGGVLPTLSAVSLASDESIDLRYAAFTAIERAGPTPDCVVILREIARDETLGDAARSVLTAWRIAS